MTWFFWRGKIENISIVHCNNSMYDIFCRVKKNNSTQKKLRDVWGLYGYIRKIYRKIENVLQSKFCREVTSQKPCYALFSVFHTNIFLPFIVFRSSKWKLKRGHVKKNFNIVQKIFILTQSIGVCILWGKYTISQILKLFSKETLYMLLCGKYYLRVENL